MSVRAGSGRRRPFRVFVFVVASMFALAGASILLANSASASAPIAAPAPPAPPVAPAAAITAVTPIPPEPPVPPVPPSCVCHSTTPAPPPTVAPTHPVVVPPTVAPVAPPVLAETGTDHTTAIVVSVLMIASGCALLVVARQPRRRDHAV
jgi:hypothetical protein